MWPFRRRTAVQPMPPIVPRRPILQLVETEPIDEAELVEALEQVPGVETVASVAGVDLGHEPIPPQTDLEALTKALQGVADAAAEAKPEAIEHG